MSSNIGQKGVASIRLKGRRIEDMPLGTGNQAKEQLADAIETERLNAIAEVNAKYPHQRVDYLSARINECEMNKNRMKGFIADTQAKISEYQQLIMNCTVRDKLLKSEDDEDRRKVIYREWGRWDESALKAQIEQFRESIAATEDVIRQEDEAIREHTEVIGLCRQRDKELAKLGAKPQGS
ncbi:MAG: hypothetical protein AMS21_01850 [Gemmatimonas sp. SG8_38_2]|nr:MAG: hypothetical protein AMS21_01850 [Gemmatimonas sp. SG8_38_2]